MSLAHPTSYLCRVGRLLNCILLSPAAIIPFDPEIASTFLATAHAFDLPPIYVTVVMNSGQQVTLSSVRDSGKQNFAASTFDPVEMRVSETQVLRRPPKRLFQKRVDVQVPREPVRIGGRQVFQGR